MQGMVLLIDGKHTSGCFVNCMFRKPYKFFPGTHRFSSDNCRTAPPIEKSEGDTPGIPDNAHIIKLEQHSLLVDSFSFSFEEALAAGKVYDLMFGHRKSPDGSITYYAWWHEETGVAAH